MAPKNNTNNNDERQEELSTMIDDILSDFEQEENERQQNEILKSQHDKILDELFAEINEAEQKEEAKNEENLNLFDNESAIENNEAKKEEDVKLGEGEELVDLNVDNWEEKTDKETEEQIERVTREDRLREEANSTMFMNKLNTFNSMYGLKTDANEFVATVTEALELMNSKDEKKKTEGKEKLGNLLKNTLSDAFKAEKKNSYKERKAPDFPEIIKSANDLLRASMFAYTDLYTEEKSKKLFEATAFGGLTAGEMAELAVGKIFEDDDAWETEWDLDQKSDEAWKIQSADAKKIAEQWGKEEKPYEKLISEMNALADSGKNGMSEENIKDAYNKLVAAEWMLLNDEKMMVENPEDPYNPIPNWGNRYWKSIIQAREALNIPKHSSMRELIQNDYAAISKTLYFASYNERQINEQVMGPEVRDKIDSIKAQESEFNIQREAIKNTLDNNEPRPEDLNPDVQRYPYPVQEENEFEKHRNAEKENNFIVEKMPQEEMRLDK